MSVSSVGASGGQSTAEVLQKVGVTLLKKALKQQEAVATLVEDTAATNEKIVKENGKGDNIDTYA